MLVVPREGAMAIVVKVCLKFDGRIAWAEPLDFSWLCGYEFGFDNVPIRAGTDSAWTRFY